MHWIDAAEVREGDLIWLPYGNAELHVWSVTEEDGVIVWGGSVARCIRPGVRKPGPRREVSGARYGLRAQVGLIRREA